MKPGDVAPVESCTDVYYVDTGMYDTAEYGAVYVVDAERPAIIDTGIGTNHTRILDALDDLDIPREDVEVIAPTHVHLDHAGGAGFLAAECPNADVYVHEIGAPHLVDPGSLVAGTKRAVGDQWQFYVDPEPVPEDRVVELTNDDAVDLGDRTLDVLHAPGHAPHQVVFYDDRDDAVFTADAAGIYVPSTDEVRETSPPPNFDLDQCIEDVEAIRALAPDTLLFSHFGPYDGDTDELLAAYEDTLTDWVDAVATAYEELGDEADVEAYFAEDPDVAGVWGPLKAREETAMNVRGVLRYLKQSQG